MQIVISSSSEDDTGDFPSRRWQPDRALPRISSPSIDDIRRRFGIPDSVEIHPHQGLRDPIDKDEIVASLYQLECGLPMPVDQEICEVLTDWNNSLTQVHPSILIVIRRLFVIARKYSRQLLPYDIQQIITPRAYGGAPRRFHCIWKTDEYRLDGLPRDYKNWRKTVPRGESHDHQRDLESYERIKKLFNLSRDLFDVSYPDGVVSLIYERDWNNGCISAPLSAVPIAQCSPAPSNSKRCQSSPSLSPSLPRIQRKRYYSALNKDQPSIIKPPGERKFRRLCMAHEKRQMKWTSVRRSRRLHNKDYTFREDSLCASNDSFTPGFSGNRESLSSASSVGSLNDASESSEDISSGSPPSPFQEMNAAQVLSGMEAMRGNEFSHTVLFDGSSPNADYTSAAHTNLTPPGSKEATHENDRGVIQFHQTSSPLPHLPLFPVYGPLGKNSDNPCFGSENVRERRPSTVPDTDIGIEQCAAASEIPSQSPGESDHAQLFNSMAKHCELFMNSMVRLNTKYNQRLLARDANARIKQDVLELEATNAKLTATVASMAEELNHAKGLLESALSEFQRAQEDRANSELVLTTELSRIKQELADSKSREVQLQTSLDEIRGILHKPLGRNDSLPNN
ncbi:hypothetical protein MKW94_005002 [Papaver nudicaule]|uniref:Uncharacterized protein n=1 Tax=Papaver nudicaule TaxID=74823 RepID=A0AA41RWH9_PAPNU|nr:hypothetical protein [Papaver nudicaule]